MDKISVSKLDEVYLQVSCDSGIARELAEFFSFFVPGYQFMPAYKMRMWNGKINLFNQMNYTLYIGLLPYLKEFCASRDYTLDVCDELTHKQKCSFEDCQKFLETLELPFEARDYQIEAIRHGIKNHRALLLSPTGSGKSLIIYALARYYNKKTLVIVPTISLVSQMFSDFKNYAKNQPEYNVDKICHPIYGGQEKITDKKVVISTWQSIYKLPKSWFEQFDVVIGDEVHLFKAKSLMSIMSKLDSAKYRFGTTGTLDGTQTHKLVLEGLFGTTFAVTTTKSLMDKKQLADLSIECIVLKYDKDIIKARKKDNYQDEIKFLVQHEKRNMFIRNLAVSTKSNTLVIFQLVELHGKVLYNLIKEKAHKIDPNRKVFFVSGETDAEVREEIRQITENEKDAIIVASSGVFSTGINIRNLENIIFASPTKSRIKTLQSIGRTLRIGDNSDKAKLYDIVDDMTDKSHKNFAVKHFLERVKIYNEEKFKYKLHKVNLF
jgi:superfamily II DNA or RNA helicase